MRGILDIFVFGTNSARHLGYFSFFALLLQHKSILDISSSLDRLVNFKSQQVSQGAIGALVDLDLIITLIGPKPEPLNPKLYI